jgi:O-antigen ligase
MSVFTSPRSVVRSPWWLPAAILAAAIFGALGVALAPLSAVIVIVGASIVVIGTLIEPGFGLIVTLLVGPWAAWMNVYAPGLLPVDAGQIMVALTLGAWLLRGLAHRDLCLPSSPLLGPLLIFTGWAGVTLLWASDLSFGLPELIKWFEIAAIMLFAIDLTRRRGYGWVVAAVLLTGVTQALIGIYEARLRGTGPIGFLLSEGVYRAYGTFEQPNPFAGFIGLTLPVAVALAAYYAAGSAYGVIRRQALFVTRHSSVAKHAVLLLTCAVITLCLALALYLSFSRGAWLAAAAAIGAMIILAPRRWWLGLGLAAVAVSGLLALSGAGLLPQSINARLADAGELFDIRDVRGVPINDANYALIERQAHWQAALNMLTDKPWTGVGFANYQPAYEQYRLLNWPMPLGHAHNIYLNVAAETGLPGLAAYGLLWLTIIGVTLRTIRRVRGIERAMAIGLMGTWIHLSTHLLVDNLYVNNTHLLIGALLGLLVALRPAGEGSPR